MPAVADVLGAAPEAPPEIDTATGLSFTDQMALAAADGPDEKKAYLANVYGPKNVHTDPKGTIYVTIDGKAVAAEGGPMLKRMGAEAVAKGPEMVGMAGGGILGAAGGPPGIVAGAAGGAMLGKAAEEWVKGGRGYLRKSANQEAGALVDAGEAGAEGELGGRAAGAVIGRIARGGLPKAVTGTTQEIKDQFKRVTAAGGRPSIQSTAPDMRHLQRMEIMADKISGAATGRNAANRAALEKMTKDVLVDGGVPKTHVDAAYADMRSGAYAETGETAGASVQRRVQAHADALETQVQAKMASAENAVDQQRKHLDALITRHPVGGLGVDVSEGIQTARRDFGTAAEKAYSSVDRLVGNKPIVTVKPVVQVAQRIVKLSKGIGGTPEAGQVASLKQPPQVNDATVQLFRDLGVEMPPPGAGGMMTLQQAQRARTILRERANSSDLTPGVTKHELGQLADGFDRAIQSAARQTENEPAIRLLNQIDAWYGKNIKKFNDLEINQLVSRFKTTGITADPEVIARLIVKSGETSRALEIKKLVGADTWKRVQAQDVQNLLYDATDPMSGEVSGPGLGDAIFKRRGLMDAVHGSAESARMMTFARSLAAVQGKLPANAITEPGFRALMTEYEAAQKEFNEFVDVDPVGALRDPKITPVQVYARVVDPTKKNLLVQTAKFLGDKSPEMNDLRETALRRILAESVYDFNAEGSVASNIGTQLAKYSREQVQILFPNGTEQAIRQLAGDMEFLMPVVKDPAMAGMSAGSKLGQPAVRFGMPRMLGGKGLVSGRLYMQAMASLGRWIIDHPGFQRYLVGERKAGKLAGGAQSVSMNFARLFAAQADDQGGDDSGQGQQ